MLQDIRKNSQGTIAKIIVGLIVVAFAGFGVESILLGGGGSGAASVNGEDITPQELQQAVNNQKRRLIAMLGENIDPAMLDDDRLTSQAMESLIQRKLLNQSAHSLGLSVTESQVAAVIGGMEQFQIDGQFSPEVYRGTLSNAGFTPLTFKRTLQEDMVIGQARSGLSGSEFATPAELELNARIAGEQRDLRYITIPLEDFSAQVNVSEADIVAYYEGNSNDFLSSEAVELDYIELLVDDYREPVDEQLLNDAYQQEIQDNQYQTESRVSHILFEAGADADDAALQTRIDNAQAKLAEGVSFADVARDYSDDIGSANFGGDLGYSAGDAFPPEMEAAIAVLELNQVSGPIETEAGVHIILLTERREGKPPTFEEMRAELEDSLQLAEARVELVRTVESLKDLAFNAEDLSDPAESLSLDVSSSEKVQRDQKNGLFASPQLIAAAFSEEVLEAGHNSEVIELNRDHWVVLRVRQHHPAQVKPLEQVSGEIVAAITDQRAREAVTQAAEEAVAGLRGGTSVETLATESGYEWQVELGADRRNLVVPREILQGAFSLAAPAEGESSIDYVLGANGDALVFELDRVSPGSLQMLPQTERQSLQQLVGAEYSQVIDTEYQQGLRDSAEINVM